jgi:hypothetical protein
VSALLQRYCQVCFLCSLVLLSACSSTTFVYNRLDFLLPWYLDDYADLNRGQKDYLDELIAPLLDWHRNEELPRYVEIISRIEVSLDRTLSPADASRVLSDFQEAWFRLEGLALDKLLDLGTQMSDKQIQGFLKELNKRQQDYEEKYLTRSDKEFYEESYENLLDSLQDYLGKLNSEQRGLVLQASGQLQRSDHIWLREEAAWLQQLAVLLERTPGWQQRVREAVAARRENLPPDYVQTYDHNLDVVAGVIVELLNGRSDKQDKRLRNKLGDLRDDLNTLIAQGKAAS